ncbi:MAG: hypothetical protein AAGN46_17535, partial [Acidobacteriota bacterium]
VAPRVLSLDAPAEVQLRVRDVIEERVRVTSPDDHVFIAVVVPLAAGLEVLDPTLATAPPEATPSRRSTQQATYVDRRDDHVAFYFDALPKGTHDLVFRARATVAGSFVQPPARAEAMYDLATMGRSAAARVIVEPVEEDAAR